MKRLIQLIVIAAGALIALPMNADSVRYLERDETVDAVPLSVAIAPGKSIYLLYVWGLDVENVICDGKDVPITIGDVILDEDARYMARIGAGNYVYMIPARGRFIFARGVGENGATSEIVGRVIPDRWTTLELRLRVRFVDGSVSELQRAMYYRLSYADAAIAHQGRIITREPEGCILHQSTPVPKP